MTKIYKLLIDSPEYPKDSYVQWNDYYDGYEAYYANGKNIYNGSHAILFSAEQIENYPEVWGLVEDNLDLRSPEAENMREESMATGFDLVPKMYKEYIKVKQYVQLQDSYDSKKGDIWINDRPEHLDFCHNIERKINEEESVLLNNKDWFKSQGYVIRECRRCNGKIKCSKHFKRHSCCGSEDYNYHNYTCINND